MTFDRQTYRLMAIVTVVAVIAAVGAALFAASGDSAVSVEGVIALGLGVFATILLCGGLMAAMFQSDRSGLDQ